MLSDAFKNPAKSLGAKSKRLSFIRIDRRLLYTIIISLVFIDGLSRCRNDARRSHLSRRHALPRLRDRDDCSAHWD